jgi:hypothetical protein
MEQPEVIYTKNKEPLRVPEWFEEYNLIPVYRLPPDLILT